MKHSKLIPGKKHAPEELGDVLVLGLGKSGRVAAEYLAAQVGTRVKRLVVAGGERSESACAFADRLIGDAAAHGANIEVFFDRETFDEHYDLCISSPGISQFSSFYRNAEAASDEVVSEIEFAWRESADSSKWIAITGTNGKTTTTALTAHLLASSGLDARAVGNIGDVALAAVSAVDAPEIYVVEVSSYQLAGTQLFAPDAAVILNITPDHLSWHKSHEHYVAAKFKVLDNLHVTQAPAILDATDDTLRAKIREIKGTPADQRGFPVIPLGTASGLRESMVERCGAENAAWIDDGVMRIDRAGKTDMLCATSDLKIKGDHNVANALAAAAAALAICDDAKRITAALCTFEPLVHRIEPCGSVAGVECFNDSKATNVDAVLKAIEAFPSGTIVLLLGGRDKGTDLAPLVDSAVAHARAVVCFGEARGRFLEAFRTHAPSVELVEAGNMESALDAGLALAQRGDVVLLSPACASFDEFSCYQERGDVFRALVEQRAAAREDCGRA